MTLVVRTSSNAAGLGTAVLNAVQQVDATVPVRNVLTMEDVVSTSLTQQRFNTLLLGVFAAVALILAALGIYSVLSYSVKRRVSEIGIRLALGAKITDVLRMVIFDAMKPTLLGLAIGAAIALISGRVMSSLVYEIKPADPLTFVCVVAFLALVALSASMIPAYRAAKVDPNVALRYE